MLKSLFAAGILCVPALAVQSTGHDFATKPGEGPSKDAIDAAVARGVDWLLRAQNRDGSWSCDFAGAETHHSIRSGNTALATYALTKCGLSADHAALQRALLCLERELPEHTYALAAQIVALEALHDPARKPRIQKLADELASLRSKKGFAVSKGYGYWPGRMEPNDLSNMQYAALGFRAALKAGCRVPKDVWLDLLDVTLKLQEPHEVDAPKARTGAPQEEASQKAGFCYVPSEKEPSASMTAAGLCLLAIVDESLQGKLPTNVAPQFLSSRAAALAWLEDGFDLETNKGGSDAWLYSYVYAVERVAGLFGKDRFGGVPWYSAGSRQLLRDQQKDGSWFVGGGEAAWPPRPMTISNTCFALLFLAQATQPRSGERLGPPPPPPYLAESPKAGVKLRASGRDEITAWISGFGEDVLAKAGVATADGVRLVSVEFLLDGASVTKIDATGKAFHDRELVFRRRFEANGAHELVARVSLLDAGGSEIEESSDVLAFEAKDVLEPWMLDYARGERNLLLGIEDAEIDATSEVNDVSRPSNAVDGLEFRGWIAKESDAAPRITIGLKNHVKAKELVLSQPNASVRERAKWGRVTRVRLVLNEDTRFTEFALDPDPLKKTVHVFEKPTFVKRLVLEIVERTPGEKGLAAGFAEIALR